MSTGDLTIATEQTGALISYPELICINKNIEMMKEYGLEISLITLKRWRKENNITKYKKH